MAWRAMNSLLVLRDQVNQLAPNRTKGADGLVADANHSTTSDHYPHPVTGVGDEMVTALDLTHDPANGFDSYRFADVLRSHRDPRIKYVISNKRIFSSYTSSSGRLPWVWGTYTGTDPHTNHVHISVLDAPIGDLKTPWNLEGFMALTDDELNRIALKVWNWDLADGPTVELAYRMLKRSADQATEVSTDVDDLREQVAALDEKVQLILDKLDQVPPGVTSFTFTGTATPQA